MGEATFAQWCASQGLPANSSKVDMTGWDFLVEFDFPTPVSSEISMVHMGAFDCKVQVKSTDKNNGSWGIKLSVLKRMVTSTMPCFFLFLEFDGQSLPQRAFLRHVDHEFCTAVVKHLHDEDIAGISQKLHKKTMAVKYDSSLSVSTQEEAAALTSPVPFYFRCQCDAHKVWRLSLHQIADGTQFAAPLLTLRL